MVVESPPGTHWPPLPARFGRVRRCGLLQGQTMLAGMPGNPGAGHLFATTRWHGVLRPQLDGFNQVLGLDAGHDKQRTSASGCGMGSPCLGRAADLAVARAVVDEVRACRRRRLGRWLCPAARRHGGDGPGWGWRPAGGPPPPPRPSAQPAEPCLVMWPRCTVVSDSRCRGVKPAQLHSWRGPGEARDVADLDHEDGGQHRTHSTDGLDGVIAGVILQGGDDAPSMSTSRSTTSRMSRRDSARMA